MKGAGADSVHQPTTEERVFLAPQWKLAWWRFKKHRIALVGTVVLSAFLIAALFPGTLAFHDPHDTHGTESLVPPQPVHDWWKLKPYVYELVVERNPDTFALEHKPDKSKKIGVSFLARGFEYRFLGLFKTDIHLLGLETESPRPLYILGTDRIGRDVWSRVIYAIRLSLSIGLVGMSMSLFLGVVIGGVSGYIGGWVDILIQRLIEFIISIPTLPLWIVLSALVPKDWHIVQVYFALVTIISLLGWTGMARVIRGRYLSIREEDFITAARLSGATQTRIMFRHMLPSFTSYIIAWTTLHIPQVIIAETALSFLGVGLRSPAISLGVMLVEAQNIRSLVLYPWVLIPGLAVIIMILCFNFVGDGVRDAADPYGGR